MISKVFKSVCNFIGSFATDERTRPIKRDRHVDDSDSEQETELVKRLCSMTEHNVMKSSKTPTTVLSARDATHQPTSLSDSWHFASKERDDLAVGKCSFPVSSMSRPLSVSSVAVTTAAHDDNRAASRPTSAFTFKPVLPDDSEKSPDVLILKEVPASGNRGGGVKNKFFTSDKRQLNGVRNFRHMMENSSVAKAPSPLKKWRSQRPQHRTLFDKFFGSSSSGAALGRFKAGFNSLNCFMLEERALYERVLKNHQHQLSFSHSPPDVASGGSSVTADQGSVDVEPSCSVASFSPPRPANLATRADESRTRARVEQAATSTTWRHTLSGTVCSPVGHKTTTSSPPSTGHSVSSATDITQTLQPPSPPAPVQHAADTRAHTPAACVSSVAAWSAVSHAVDKSLRHYSEHCERVRSQQQVLRQQIELQHKRVQATGRLQVDWERRLSSRLRRQVQLLPSAAVTEAELELSEEEGLDEQQQEPPTLVQLSEHMQSRISEALRPSPSSEVLSEAFNLTITRRDLHTLSGLNWLNDEVINFYMNMLMERSRTSNCDGDEGGGKTRLPKIYCFNTFFYGKIVASGHGSVRRWTRKVDVFAHDLLLVPVHLGMHWCLMCADLRRHAVVFYDSMGSHNERALHAMLQYLRDEHVDKKKTTLDTQDWTADSDQDIPQQMNGSDCGMFACKFAEYLSRGAAFTFSQADMPYFRRRMVYEIITKQLL